MTSEELVAFEQDIAAHFEAGEIRAPCHLVGGNETQLIEIFKHIRPQDWVFSTHRSHYHALLKGVPPELVKAEILKGNSICLQFPEYRFYTSAIVGGIIPIALGVAMEARVDYIYKGPRAGRVWCFVGDMAAETGIFHECHKYSVGHDLPIHFVVEDNGMSVDTPTEKVWRYSYQRTFPHQGSGKWVIF